MSADAHLTVVALVDALLAETNKASHQQMIDHLLEYVLVSLPPPNANDFVNDCKDVTSMLSLPDNEKLARLRTVPVTMSDTLFVLLACCIVSRTCKFIHKESTKYIAFHKLYGEIILGAPNREFMEKQYAAHLARKAQGTAE